MTIQTFAVGRFLANCYVVGCKQTGEAIIIDPGFDSNLEAEKIFNSIVENKLTPRLVVNTHGHPDHTCGNGLARERFRVPVLIHENDADMLGALGKSTTESFGFERFSPPADRLLRNGDVVSFGKKTLRVFHTPGHTRGSICLLGKKEIFTGDTLFAGSIGRTDFPEGSNTEMASSLRRIVILPDEVVAYPGHGAPTTIGEEKQSNPFMSQIGS